MNKIVLLHGWGCDSRSWAPILPQLKELGNVAAIDFPGFGESHALTTYSLDAVVNFIAPQLPDSCVIIGWSLGGMLAVQLAVRYPHKVSRIITLATNIKFVASDHYSTAMSSEANQHFNNSFEIDSLATLKMFSGLLVKGDAKERTLLKKMREFIPTEAANVNWLHALQLLSQLDNRDVFAGLTQPGLHLLGEADVLVPVAAATTLAALNAQHKVIVLPQASHALHWSQPEKVMEYIRDFFQWGQTPLMHPTASDEGSDKDKDKSIKPEPIEKYRIAKSFNRAAYTYDAAATFQRNVGEKLLSMVEAIHTVATVVDLGCGTGHITGRLQEKFLQAEVIGIDLAESMLSVARKKNPAVPAWLCGDAEKLPLASASVDVVFSSLALQWCNNLTSLFAELNLILKPGGTLIFSTLGPNTLHELKSAWQQVDNYVHVNHFISGDNVKKELLKMGFTSIQFDQQSPVLQFEKLTDLTRELKALGAHNINRGRATGLTGRQKIAAFKTAYEQLRHDSLLPATYEVFYIIAKKPSTPHE